MSKFATQKRTSIQSETRLKFPVMNTDQVEIDNIEGASAHYDRMMQFRANKKQVMDLTRECRNYMIKN